MASILIYATCECLFSFVRISEFITFNNKERQNITLVVIVNKVTSANNRLFYQKKNTTHLTRGNNLVVYLTEVTSAHNRILLESYSFYSTCLSHTEKVVHRRSVHVVAREAFLVQSDSNWV